MSGREREVIAEFIELYRDFPCLWDLNNESYKDSTQKQLAWEVLVDKLRAIDPDANIASAKKKIEHLKYSYQREAKKVKESKNQTGAAASEVHKPNLWFYELMTFLDKKSESQRSAVDTLSDEEDEYLAVSQGIKRRRKNNNLLEKKKEKLLDSAQQLLEEKNKYCSFGVYVSEKLEKVSPFQRQVAEKLISDVIFLAATNNLNFDSRIETPSRLSSTQHSPMSYSTQPIPPTALEVPIPTPPPTSHHAYDSRNATLSSQFFSTQTQSAPVNYEIRQSPSRYTIRLPTLSPNSNISIPSPNSSTRFPTPTTSYQISLSSPPAHFTLSPNSETLVNSDTTEYILGDNSECADPASIEGPAPIEDSASTEGPGSILKQLLIFKNKL